MRKIPMLMLLLAGLAGLVAPASAAPPSTTRYFVTGFGDVTHLSYVDAAGFATEGDLYALDARHGSAPDAPFRLTLAFYGMREDGLFVGGVAEATILTNSGMSSSRMQGSLVVSTFLAPENPGYVAPYAITVDLTLTGTGATHATALTFTSGSSNGSYVNFAAQRWRTATTAGSAAVQVGGDDQSPIWAPATVGAAMLLGVTTGEFNLVPMPGH
jgi:hypothetical protein